MDLHPFLNRLAEAGRLDDSTAEEIAQLISELAPHVAGSVDVRFIHNDIHDMNVMCSPAGELLAIIDWGDAGWGDPTLDFAAIPLDAIPHALEGYELEKPGALGAFPEARFIWDKLRDAMDGACHNSGHSVPWMRSADSCDRKRGNFHQRANELLQPTSGAGAPG